MKQIKYACVCCVNQIAIKAYFKSVKWVFFLYVFFFKIIKHFSYFLMIRWPVIDLYHLGYSRIDRQIDRKRQKDWGECGGGGSGAELSIFSVLTAMFSV